MKTTDLSDHWYFNKGKKIHKLPTKEFLFNNIYILRNNKPTRNQPLKTATVLNNLLCSWDLYIRWSVVHFENSINNNSIAMDTPNHLSSTKYQDDEQHELAKVFEQGFAASDYNDVIMSAMTSQIASLAVVYSSVYSDVDQRKYQSSVSLAFDRGNHRWPTNSPHKGTVTRKMFPSIWWRHHGKSRLVRKIMWIVREKMFQVGLLGPLLLLP